MSTCGVSCIVSIQPSAVSRQPCGTGFGHATRMATLCERCCEVTQHYSNAYLFYSKADSCSRSVRVAL
ncbi:MULTISPECIES: hypothetical protein [unclassified Moorena]|uniref:hypothetical protein n=1 Tax=unclassified Moorena TaxID=2683338 RepID=UPI00140046A0|nr:MULTISPECIES: hypothetical protein [unclassified Moorena]NEO16501.1 hypothetical protein [Moorena sp. SIO3E8]NEQ03163.1 hypothetical protein [Moorena sp. SIO3F7]